MGQWLQFQRTPASYLTKSIWIFTNSQVICPLPMIVIGGHRPYCIFDWLALKLPPGGCSPGMACRGPRSVTTSEASCSMLQVEVSEALNARRIAQMHEALGEQQIARYVLQIFHRPSIHHLHPSRTCSMPSMQLLFLDVTTERVGQSVC